MPSPLFKLAIALLVLVQLVAPSWHVCELGGYSCHGMSGMHARAEIWKPKCGGGPVCPCKKPPGAILSLTGQIVDGHGTAADNDFCLALLLMSMPGAIATAFALVILATRRLRSARPVLAPPSVAALRRPPARGPPQLSFA